MTSDSARALVTAADHFLDALVAFPHAAAPVVCARATLPLDPDTLHEAERRLTALMLDDVQETAAARDRLKELLT